MNWFEWLVTNAITASVLAVAVFGVTRFVKQPPVVYGLWMLVLLKLATPPIIDIPIVTRTLEKPGRVITVHLPDDATLDRSRPANSVLTAVPIRTPGEANRATVTSDEDRTASPMIGAVEPAAAASPVAWSARQWWTVGLWSVWSSGAGFFLALLIRRTWRFRRVLHGAAVAAEPVRARARALAESFGLATPPEVRAVDCAIPPLLWPFGRGSTVLIPAELLARLDDRQLETLLAHEIAHLRRRDHWVRVFEIALLTVYWWFPVLRWVLRALRDAEEQCCDAWVVWRFPESARAYASTLLTTVDYLSENYPPATRSSKPVTPPAVLPAALSASGNGRFEPLKRRFEMILQRRFARRLSPTAKIGLIAASLLVLPLAPFAVSAESTGKDKILIVKADGSKHEYEVSGDVATDVQNAIEDVLKKSSGSHTKRSVIRRSTKDGATVETRVDVKARVAGPDETVDLLSGGDGQAMIVGPDGKRRIIQLGSPKKQDSPKKSETRRGVMRRLLGADDVTEDRRILGVGGGTGHGNVTVIINGEKHEFDFDGGDVQGMTLKGKTDPEVTTHSSGKVIIIGPDGKRHEHSWGDDDAKLEDLDIDIDVEDLLDGYKFDFKALPRGAHRVDPESFLRLDGGLDLDARTVDGLLDGRMKLDVQKLLKGMNLGDVDIDVDVRGLLHRHDSQPEQHSHGLGLHGLGLHGMDPGVIDLRDLRVHGLDEDDQTGALLELLKGFDLRSIRGDDLEFDFRIEDLGIGGNEGGKTLDLRNLDQRVEQMIEKSLKLDSRKGQQPKVETRGRIEIIGPDGKRRSKSFKGGDDAGASLDAMIQRALQDALKGQDFDLQLDDLDLDVEIEKSLRDAMKQLDGHKGQTQKRILKVGPEGTVIGPDAVIGIGGQRPAKKIEERVIEELEPTLKKLEKVIEELEAEPKSTPKPTKAKKTKVVL